MELNYYQTLIAVADDCPVDHAEVPTDRGSKPSVATLQYGMLDGQAGAALAKLGATAADTQPGGERWRVMLDPVGHPFCITTVA